MGWQGFETEIPPLSVQKIGDGDLTPDPINCTEDSSTGLTNCVETFRDSANLSVVQILSQIAASTFEKNNVTLSPRKLKITVIINVPTIPANAYIALIVHHRTPAGGPAGRVDGLGLNFAGNQSRFNFENTFIDDTGNISPVLAQRTFVDLDMNGDTFDGGLSTPAGLIDGRFAFTFKKAGTTSVYWDPDISDGTTSSVSSGDSFWTAGSIIGIAIGAIVLAAIIAIIVVKKNGNVSKV